MDLGVPSAYESYSNRLDPHDEVDEDYAAKAFLAVSDQHVLLRRRRARNKRRGAFDTVRLCLRILILLVDLSILSLLIHGANTWEITYNSVDRNEDGRGTQRASVNMFSTWLMLAIAVFASFVQIIALATHLSLPQSLRDGWVHTVAVLASSGTVIAAWVIATIYLIVDKEVIQSDWDLWSWSCQNRSGHSSGPRVTLCIEMTHLKMSTPEATETPEKVPDLPPSFQETMASSPPIFQTQFACMTFNMFDRIRLINFTEVEVSAIKKVVAARWSPGLSHVQPYGESMEFRLRGRPWLHRCDGNDDSRRLMLRILEKLFDMGWVLQGAMEITLKSESKDSLIFRKQDPIPPPCDWICISFDNSDKLKIVDSPPKDLTDAILQTFGRDVRRKEITSDRVKVHLANTPWNPSGTDTVQTRIILLKLIETLERCGFTIYATIGSKGEDEEGAQDLLVCQRVKGWIPGAPIWHR
ncbi:hypothetical protein FCIRC_7255 [Fusarium circinatum]|uniref:Uncharacterized protein n=1 Tax=Fusarium circinatum TaxID=48490 RepID=A0A8H5TUJ7_FUSCI|nr:hypothetical protein FCIRC_7255 [Fusarium circinatum]